ncbi:MAG: SWIM zinc finger family protein [Methanoregulaceae archaeon]
MSDPEDTLPATGFLTEDLRSDIISRFGERGKKALRILDAGHVVRYRDFFVVQGSGGEYVVEEDFCTCGDFLFRKRECSHILAVKIARKTGRYTDDERWYQDTLREEDSISLPKKSGHNKSRTRELDTQDTAGIGEKTNSN